MISEILRPLRGMLKMLSVQRSYDRGSFKFYLKWFETLPPVDRSVLHNPATLHFGYFNNFDYISGILVCISLLRYLIVLKELI